MSKHWRKLTHGTMSGGLLVLLGACASLVSTNESTVWIETDPPQSRCQLKGKDFTTTIETPANVVVPASAAPVAVTCSARGYKPTTYSLDATANGWVWGNSALMVVTGGAAVLGLLVDETRDAGKVYADKVTYSLDADTPRIINAVERGGAEMKFQAR